MKLFLFGLFFIITSMQSCGPKGSEKKNVKQTIIKMFEIVDAGKSTELANYIVYRGDDETRKWKDNCRYINPDEKHLVQNLHQKIVDQYLPYKYEFVNFASEKESEGEWLVWEMNFFTEDKEPKKVYFAFLKVDGKYLLGDID